MIRAASKLVSTNDSISMAQANRERRNSQTNLDSTNTHMGSKLRSLNGSCDVTGGEEGGSKRSKRVLRGGGGAQGRGRGEYTAQSSLAGIDNGKVWLSLL